MKDLQEEGRNPATPVTAAIAEVTEGEVDAAALLKQAIGLLHQGTETTR